MKKRSFIIRYEQWLEEFEDRPGWSEKKEISVKVTSDALTSRWLAEFDQPLDYLVLTVIGLHARPMTLDDVEEFKQFGLVTQQDVGRLFTYVTNETLAIELNKDRKTIAASTYRLAERGILVVRSLPKPEASDQIRSRGKFRGNKIYILSGDIAIKKEVEERAETHRVQFLDTVKPESASIVPKNWTHRVESFPTNIDDDLKEDEGEDRPAPIFDTEDYPETIRAIFAELTQKADYELTPGDLKAITRLSKLHTTLDEVRQGIHDILDSGKKPKTFAYCAPQVETICQNRPTERHHPNAKPTTPRPTTAGQSETATDTRQPNTTQPTTETIPAELQTSVDIFKQLTGNTPTSEQIGVMKSLALLADKAAGKTGETGAQWLYAALYECSIRDGIRYPLRYAATTIRNRVSTPTSPKKNGNGNGDRDSSSTSEHTAAPEVALYRSVTGFAPRPDQVDALVEKLSGKSWDKKYLLTFWREWCARDHKRHNIGWLDWAQDGRIPKPAQRSDRKKTVNLS